MLAEPRACLLYVVPACRARYDACQGTNQVTVLVVDDDREFLAELTPVLTKAGYSVIAVTDGDEALRRLEAGHASIDAAIIDLDLPGTGGFQVIGAIARDRQTTTPIMAITGAYSDVHLEVAQYLGAQVAIRKPPPGASLDKWAKAVDTMMKAQAEMDDMDA